MNFKAQNLYFGVIDLFSVLIPGAIMSIALYHNFEKFISHTFVIDISSPNYTLGLLLLSAYIIGHVINRIGSLLDKPIYDRWKKSKSESHRKVAQKLMSKDGDADHIDSAFTRAKYRILQSGSPIIHKIEKETADSKFFRSLLVISVILLVIYIIKANWVLAVLSTLLALFSRWSYLKLRYKSTVTAYKYIIFLEAMKGNTGLEEIEKKS